MNGRVESESFPVAIVRGRFNRKNAYVSAGQSSLDLAVCTGKGESDIRCSCSCGSCYTCDLKEKQQQQQYVM